MTTPDPTSTQLKLDQYIALHKYDQASSGIYTKAYSQILADPTLIPNKTTLANVAFSLGYSDAGTDSSQRFIDLLNDYNDFPVAGPELPEQDLPSASLGREDLSWFDEYVGEQWNLLGEAQKTGDDDKIKLSYVQLKDDIFAEVDTLSRKFAKNYIIRLKLEDDPDLDMSRVNEEQIAGDFAVELIANASNIERGKILGAEAAKSRVFSEQPLEEVLAESHRIFGSDKYNVFHENLRIYNAEKGLFGSPAVVAELPFLGSSEEARFPELGSYLSARDSMNNQARQLALKELPQIRDLSQVTPEIEQRYLGIVKEKLQSETSKKSDVAAQFYNYQIGWVMGDPDSSILEQVGQAIDNIWTIANKPDPGQTVTEFSMGFTGENKDFATKKFSQSTFAINKLLTTDNAELDAELKTIVNGIQGDHRPRSPDEFKSTFNKSLRDGFKNNQKLRLALAKHEINDIDDLPKLIKLVKQHHEDYYIPLRANQILVERAVNDQTFFDKKPSFGTSNTDIQSMLGEKGWLSDSISTQSGSNGKVEVESRLREMLKGATVIADQDMESFKSSETKAFELALDSYRDEMEDNLKGLRLLNLAHSDPGVVSLQLQELEISLKDHEGPLSQQMQANLDRLEIESEMIAGYAALKPNDLQDRIRGMEDITKMQASVIAMINTMRLEEADSNIGWKFFEKGTSLLPVVRNLGQSVTNISDSFFQDIIDHYERSKASGLSEEELLSKVNTRTGAMGYLKPFIDQGKNTTDAMSEVYALEGILQSTLAERSVDDPKLLNEARAFHDLGNIKNVIDDTVMQQTLVKDLSPVIQEYFKGADPNDTVSEAFRKDGNVDQTRLFMKANAVSSMSYKKATELAFGDVMTYAGIDKRFDAKTNRIVSDQNALMNVFALSSVAEIMVEQYETRLGVQLEIPGTDYRVPMSLLFGGGKADRDEYWSADRRNHIKKNPLAQRFVDLGVTKEEIYPMRWLFDDKERFLSQWDGRYGFDGSIPTDVDLQNFIFWYTSEYFPENYDAYKNAGLLDVYEVFSTETIATLRRDMDKVAVGLAVDKALLAGAIEAADQRGSKNVYIKAAQVIQKMAVGAVPSGKDIDNIMQDNSPNYHPSHYSEAGWWDRVMVATEMQSGGTIDEYRAAVGGMGFNSGSVVDNASAFGMYMSMRSDPESLIFGGAKIVPSAAYKGSKNVLLNRSTLRSGGLDAAGIRSNYYSAFLIGAADEIAPLAYFAGRRVDGQLGQITAVDMINEKTKAWKTNQSSPDFDLLDLSATTAMAAAMGYVLGGDVGAAMDAFVDNTGLARSFSALSVKAMGLTPLSRKVDEYDFYTSQSMEEQMKTFSAMRNQEMIQRGINPMEEIFLAPRKERLRADIKNNLYTKLDLYRSMARSLGMDTNKMLTMYQSVTALTQNNHSLVIKAMLLKDTGALTELLKKAKDADIDVNFMGIDNLLEKTDEYKRVRKEINAIKSATEGMSDAEADYMLAEHRLIAIAMSGGDMDKAKAYFNMISQTVDIDVLDPKRIDALPIDPDDFSGAALLKAWKNSTSYTEEAAFKISGLHEFLEGKENLSMNDIREFEKAQRYRISEIPDDGVRYLVPEFKAPSEKMNDYDSIIIRTDEFDAQVFFKEGKVVTLGEIHILSAAEGAQDLQIKATKILAKEKMKDGHTTFKWDNNDIFYQYHEVPEGMFEAFDEGINSYFLSMYDKKNKAVFSPGVVTAPKELVKSYRESVGLGRETRKGALKHKVAAKEAALHPSLFELSNEQKSNIELQAKTLIKERAVKIRKNDSALNDLAKYDANIISKKLSEVETQAELEKLAKEYPMLLGNMRKEKLVGKEVTAVELEAIKKEYIDGADDMISNSKNGLEAANEKHRKTIKDQEFTIIDIDQSIYKKIGEDKDIRKHLDNINFVFGEAGEAPYREPIQYKGNSIYSGLNPSDRIVARGTSDILFSEYEMSGQTVLVMNIVNGNEQTHIQNLSLYYQELKYLKTLKTKKAKTESIPQMEALINKMKKDLVLNPPKHLRDVFGDSRLAIRETLLDDAQSPDIIGYPSENLAYGSAIRKELRYAGIDFEEFDTVDPQGNPITAIVYGDAAKTKFKRDSLPMADSVDYAPVGILSFMDSSPDSPWLEGIADEVSDSRYQLRVAMEDTFAGYSIDELERLVYEEVITGDDLQKVQAFITDAKLHGREFEFHHYDKDYTFSARDDGDTLHIEGDILPIHALNILFEATAGRYDHVVFPQDLAVWSEISRIAENFGAVVDEVDKAITINQDMVDATPVRGETLFSKKKDKPVEKDRIIDLFSTNVGMSGRTFISAKESEALLLLNRNVNGLYRPDYLFDGLTRGQLKRTKGAIEKARQHLANREEPDVVGILPIVQSVSETVKILSSEIHPHVALFNQDGKVRRYVHVSPPNKGLATRRIVIEQEDFFNAKFIVANNADGIGISSNTKQTIRLQAKN